MISTENQEQLTESIGKAELITRISIPRLDYMRLLSYYKAFVDYVEQESGKKFDSFATNSFIDREENYKYAVHSEAHRRLDFYTWKRADIGSGKIINHVITAFEIEEKDLRNNLVQHARYRRYEETRYHRSLYEAQEIPQVLRQYEQLLFEFFHGEIEDSVALEQFVRFAGRKYSYIAYLYFLKDWSRYLPIAPDTFDNAFKMLGIEFKTSTRCSWENYLTYNGLVGKVRKFLADKLESEVRLLDAHTFLWVIGRPPQLSPKTIEASYQYYTPTAATSVVITASHPSKPDYLEQYKRQIEIGQLAEDIVLENEKHRLRKWDRNDLAEKVKSVSHDPACGYDICSFDEEGQEMQIEVKAVRSETGCKTFFLTQNELEKSQSLPNYRLYLVTDVNSPHPRILVIKKPQFEDVTQFNLEVVNYRVSIR